MCMLQGAQDTPVSARRVSDVGLVVLCINCCYAGDSTTVRYWPLRWHQHQQCSTATTAIVNKIFWNIVTNHHIIIIMLPVAIGEDNNFNIFIKWMKWTNEKVIVFHLKENSNQILIFCPYINVTDWILDFQRWAVKATPELQMSICLLIMHAAHCNYWTLCQV